MKHTVKFIRTQQNEDLIFTVEAHSVEMELFLLCYKDLFHCHPSEMYIHNYILLDHTHFNILQMLPYTGNLRVVACL